MAIDSEVIGEASDVLKHVGDKNPIKDVQKVFDEVIIKHYCKRKGITQFWFEDKNSIK